MTYPMFDHLRLLTDVLTASGFVLGLGSLAVCVKLLIDYMPTYVSPAAA